MIDKYTIRTAVPADKERICSLFEEMLRTIYDTDDVKGYEDGVLDKYFTGGEDRIYVAESDEVAAYLSVEVHHEPGDYIYLDDFSVARAHRNKGVGTALIVCSESYAREMGIPLIFLHVEQHNSAALRLYQRLGWSVCSYEGHRYLMKKYITK